MQAWCQDIRTPLTNNSNNNSTLEELITMNITMHDSNSTLNLWKCVVCTWWSCLWQTPSAYVLCGFLGAETSGWDPWLTADYIAVLLPWDIVCMEVKALYMCMPWSVCLCACECVLLKIRWYTACPGRTVDLMSATMHLSHTSRWARVCSLYCSITSPLLCVMEQLPPTQCLFFTSTS